MPPETDQVVTDVTEQPPPSELPPVDTVEDDEPAEPPLEVDHDMVAAVAKRAFPSIDWDSKDHDQLVEQTNALDEVERFVRIAMAVSENR